VDAGAPLYPLDIYEGENGKEIDNKNVITKLLHISKVVAQKDNLFLGIKRDSAVVLLSQIMSSNTRQHKENVSKLLLSHNIPLKVSGLYKVEHKPPETRDNPQGTLALIFSTEGNTNFEIIEPFVWTEAENFSYEKERKLLEGYKGWKSILDANLYFNT